MRMSVVLHIIKDQSRAAVRLTFRRRQPFHKSGKARIADRSALAKRDVRLCGLMSSSTVFSRLAKVPHGKTLGWPLQGSCGNTGK
jgi:hypothetical protein